MTHNGHDNRDAIFGFHSLKVTRKGLFHATLLAAEKMGMQSIDVTIGAQNLLGFRYDEALEFQSYHQTARAICKQFEIGIFSSPVDYSSTR